LDSNDGFDSRYLKNYFEKCEEVWRQGGVFFEEGPKIVRKLKKVSHRLIIRKLERNFGMEQVAGVEPASSVWKTDIITAILYLRS
jgi:hypothetical protein